ncbi:hypothetical protein [Lacticaseibacillus saniviri]|uniref:Uncharacterized protein n=1 Tax=Lacticaseibacillus saniviri JCM 17471 = DSM 24301 TaxID=1293598 RepID=A0A0R2MQJ4_9LACO|nr:hypothetical protein [Lacticaseibacillus saniviri]KRO15897.1 hypothetical protein IV56_GL002087 [Lacticaseibacillus saniviri JCM 17471 = DSM 24301]
MIELEGSVEGDSGLEEMIARLKQVDGQSVSAGVFGGFAAQKAMWNEYGTSRGIPARPFLRNTLYEHGSEWTAFVRPLMVAVMNGSEADVAAQLGPKMATSIQQTIKAGGFAPLAPSTIKKKGSSQPLIDTGDMIGAVTWRKGE